MSAAKGGFMRNIFGVAMLLLAACSGSQGSTRTDAATDGALTRMDAGADAATNPDATTPTGGSCVLQNVPFGGFNASEVSVEGPGSVCEGQFCVAYHLQGDPRSGCTGSTCADPTEVATRVFCSCRCGAPAGVPGPFCTCPSGMTCETLLESGASELRGDYCVPTPLTSAP